MKVIISGGYGFIGKTLVKELVDLGYEVHLVLNKNRNIDFSDGVKKSYYVDLSLNDHNFDEEQFDVAIHLAGKTLGADLDAAGYNDANELTLINFLKSTSKNCRKFIIASSQVVYGDPNSISISEHFPTDPTHSYYGCSKINSENWARIFQSKFGGSYVFLRFTGFIEGGGLIKYLYDKALSNEPIELFSNGEIIRDYIALKDGVNAIILSVQKKFTEGIHPINIGSGQKYTSKQLAELIIDNLSSESKVITTGKSAPQGNFVFNISKATNLICFRPSGMVSGIIDYINQLRKLDA